MLTHTSPTWSRVLVVSIEKLLTKVVIDDLARTERTAI